jgi:hypothetical protein
VVIIGSPPVSSATIKLDCDGSSAAFANESSPVEAFCVCRRNAASPANNSGESPGASGTSPSADGASPTADNSVDANGVSTGSGSDTTTGSSSDAFVVGVVTGATLTTDTSLTAGVADAGSDFGCTAAVVCAAGSLSLTPLSDGVFTTERFGFFGVAATEKSEPDFLSLTVDPVDFLLLLSLSVGSFSPPLSPASTVDPASSAPDSPDDSVVADEEPSVEPDEVDVDESDDELVEPASVGSAHATPGVVATATPTPKANAKPPTRPTYLA